MEYGLGIPARGPLANLAYIEVIAARAEALGFSWRRSPIVSSRMAGQAKTRHMSRVSSTSPICCAHLADRAGWQADRANAAACRRPCRAQPWPAITAMNVSA